MQPKPPHYTVTAHLALPDFEAEYAFVRLERQYVARQLARPIRGWAALARFLDRAPTQGDWLHYDHALQRYEHNLQKHSDEITAGLWPVKLVVRNDGGHGDRSIRIHIAVQHGEIHPAKKLPERPKRIDGGALTNWWGLMEAGRFWRSGIKVTAHNIEAKFSRLGREEAAYVVNDPIYIKASEDMTLTYEIRSHALTTAQTGRLD
jgi:hypothetical protein